MKKLYEGRYPTARRGGAVSAETREEFELERVASCWSGDHRRRAKLNFGSRKPLHDLHRATTVGAVPKIRRVFGGGNVLFGLRLMG